MAPRSHLFYDGPVANHDFKNFEVKAEVMAKAGANSGVYFHTEWQEKGLPDKGFEVQVNNTHKDPKKTAGLYDLKDNFEAPAKDDEWFTLTIRVEGKHVVTKVNDKVITDYVEPDDFQPAPKHPGPQDRPRHLRHPGPRPGQRGAFQKHPGQAAAVRLRRERNTAPNASNVATSSVAATAPRPRASCAGRASGADGRIAVG